MEAECNWDQMYIYDGNSTFSGRSMDDNEDNADDEGEVARYGRAQAVWKESTEAAVDEQLPRVVAEGIVHRQLYTKTLYIDSVYTKTFA